MVSSEQHHRVTDSLQRLFFIFFSFFVLFLYFFDILGIREKLDPFNTALIARVWHARLDSTVLQSAFLDIFQVVVVALWKAFPCCRWRIRDARLIKHFFPLIIIKGKSLNWNLFSVSLDAFWLPVSVVCCSFFLFYFYFFRGLSCLDNCEFLDWVALEPMKRLFQWATISSKLLLLLLPTV